MKSKIEYPYKLTCFLPAGHPFGLKKREFIRKEYFKTEGKCDSEYRVWVGMGIKVIKERR